MLNFIKGVFYTMVILFMLFIGACTVSFLMLDSDSLIDQQLELMNK